MKKKLQRLLASTLTLAMALALTGCTGMKAEMSLTDTGSGSIEAKVGYTKEGLEMLWEINADDMDGTIEEFIAEAESFEIDDTTYYGESETENFDNIKELNQMLSDVTAAGTVSSEYGIGFAAYNGDIYFGFAPRIAEDEGEYQAELSDYAIESGYSESEVQKLIAETCILYVVEMPNTVTLVTDENEYKTVTSESAEGFKQAKDTSVTGISIENNIVTIDVLKVEPVEEYTLYLFKSEANVTEDIYLGETTADEIYDEDITEYITFDDVASDFWAYEAIQWAADRGIVVGVGNNKFEPNGTLTRAQFYTMISRYTYIGDLYDTESDYWAENYIRACIDFGYVLGVEEQPEVINKSDWDVPMLREEAVTAMMLVEGYWLEANEDIDSTMIPDFNAIDEQYSQYILDAYKCGVTVGTDANRTFAPKSQLTRAQGCQLLYRLYDSIYQ